MSPRVSVLLTTWNRPDMLRQAAKSVLTQTYADWELIILDDNSDDVRQRRALSTLAAKPKVRLYVDDVRPDDRMLKVRYAALANIGLALARGHYVTYLCDDDLYVPTRLEHMTARLDEGDCQVVYGRQLLRYPDGEKPGTEVTPGRILRDAWWRVDHSSVMHTRSVALEVGGWDEDPRYWKHADAAFWRRLNQAGHWFFPVCEYTDIRRFHSGSVTAGALD